MTFRSLVVTAYIILVAISGLFAWRVTTLATANSLQLRTIQELNAKLAASQQRFIEQRELLRQDAIANTTRSPDEFLALFPARFPAGNWRPAEDAFEDCWFRSSDGLRLHGWLIQHPQSKITLLLLHGNAGNLTHRAERAELLSRRYQASIFIFDYRGYGRSEGTPTISGVLDDARAARAFFAEREGLAENKIVLLGESLGGAIAVDLASRDGARGLILESAFSSLRDVAATHYPAILVDTLVADRLNSAARIGDYHGPILQVHGDSDQVIPLALGQKVHDAANEPKTLVILPGHDHNDPLPATYYEALNRFFSTLK